MNDNIYWDEQIECKSISYQNESEITMKNKEFSNVKKQNILQNE